MRQVPTEPDLRAGCPIACYGVFYVNEPAHSKGRVEKAMKRHREERSDVAISLAFN
jgi:hypothetical protein